MRFAFTPLKPFTLARPYSTESIIFGALKHKQNPKGERKSNNKAYEAVYEHPKDSSLCGSTKNEILVCLLLKVTARSLLSVFIVSDFFFWNHDHRKKRLRTE